MGDVVALRSASARALADKALALAYADSETAMACARASLDAVGSEPDIEAEVLAERALGLALRGLNDEGAYALSWAYAPHERWSWGESNPRPSANGSSCYDHSRRWD